MKIYLMRHGQTTGDIEDRYGGAYDDHLTDTGRNQSQELANKLEGSGIQVLYSSPLIRTQQTASIVQAKLNCEMITINDFRERNKNGILSGMTKSEAILKYPELVEQLKDYRNQITGAEAQEDFAKRINNAFVNVVKSSKHSIVGIVTHGGPIWAIFTNILNIHTLAHIGDCAHIILDVNDKKITLIQSDGITHNPTSAMLTAK